MGLKPRCERNSVTFARKHIQEQPLIFSGNLKACESAEILSWQSSFAKKCAMSDNQKQLLTGIRRQNILFCQFFPNSFFWNRSLKIFENKWRFGVIKKCSFALENVISKSAIKQIRIAGWSSQSASWFCSELNPKFPHSACAAYGSSKNQNLVPATIAFHENFCRFNKLSSLQISKIRAFNFEILSLHKIWCQYWIFAIQARLGDFYFRKITKENGNYLRRLSEDLVKKLLQLSPVCLILWLRRL